MFLTHVFKRAKRQQSRSQVRSLRRRGRLGLRLEPLEDRTLPSVTLLNHYNGLNFGQSGGYIPPDSQGAAGTTNYVESVNQTLGIYSPKATGSSLVSDSFSHFLYTTGALPRTDSSSFLSDPIVVWDDQIQRFIVGDQDVDFNTHLSNFDLAVSKSASPATLGTSDWKFYQVSTTETGFDADFPGNFGFNHDAFVFNLNMFGVVSGGHVLVTAISQSDLSAGNPITPFKNDLTDFSVRPTVMHDAVAGDPMWMVTEHGDNLSIDVYKVTNILSSSPTFTKTNLLVNAYSQVLPPKQPNGTTITTNIDSRILKAAEYNHTVVATHAISVSGTEDDARWYNIDVSSGTPVLHDQGNISAGSNTYIYYPGIEINSSSSIGMTYMQSGTGSGQFMSTYMTGRLSTDPAGTMETPVLVQAGAKEYSDFGGRAGDLSGINTDSDGTFWSANEFADSETGSANWGTAIGHISVTGASDTYSVTASPTSQTAGNAVSVTVTALTSGGSTDTGYRGTVHFTSSDSQAVLPADYTFTSTDAGVHTFTNGVTLKTAGNQTVTATDTVTSSITGSVTVTVTAAAASTLTVAGFPSPTTAGTPGTFTVTAKDAFSNTATGYTGTVQFSSSDPAAVLPANYTFTSTDAGVHTFTNGATLNTVGTQSITGTDTVTSTITGTQSGIVVNAATASSFSVTASPSSQTAGNAVSVTVTALTSGGGIATAYRGTVHFTSSDSQAVLPADYTFTSTDNGVHTFTNGVTLKTAGNQTVTASDTVTTSITGSVTVTVTAAAASTLTVTGFPSSINAGTAGTFTVTAKDPYSNTATGYRGTVHFTSSDAQAVLPADYTFTSTDAGVHTFTNGATLKTAGTQSITGTDTVTSTITGTQSGITVNALAASTLTVAGYPSPTTAGVANNFTVTAKDTYGNTATGYRGTVMFSSSDSKAGLPSPYTFTSTDSGVHTFSATLKTVGTQSITSTDAHTSTITGTQSGITVNPASASSFTVTGFPSPIVAGTAGSLTVTAKDAFGNVATGYQGTVKFSSSDQKAVLPANYTFVAADSGVHTFTNGATLKTAGTQSITATDTVTSSIRGTQGGIVVNAAATSMLRVSGFPSPVTAGTAGSVTVTAQDAYGNKTTGYTGTVHFTSTDSQAVLPADYTFTSTDAGVHTFTNGVTLKTAGNQSITATDTVTSSITGKQTVVVNPAAAATLQVTGYPSPTTAGVSHTFTVKAKDAYGNVATGYTGTVTFSSSDSKAVLPANYTFVSGDHGVHTFSATLKTAGTQSITATDTVTSSITGTQSGITVNAAAASVLVVSGYPSPIVHGTSGTFTVTAEDAYGNVATGYHGTVKFSSSDTAASLPANYTFTATDAGVHTFTATLNTVGTQSITATDTVTSSITGTQSGISVTAATVDRLFRDWLPGSAEIDDLPELLDNSEAEEQLAVALIGSSDSAGVVADEANAEIRGRRGAGSQSALGAVLAFLGLYWRDQTARRTGPRRKLEGLEPG